MVPLPIILVLRDTKTYISVPNSNNILSKIKISINKAFGLTSTLEVLDIDPNNTHIGFGEDINYSRISSHCNIFKNM